MKKSPFNSELWTGRVDAEDKELGLRLHQIIQDYTHFRESNTQPKVIIGFCSDEGVERNKGRLGAKESPDHIRKSLANLPVHFSNDQFLFDAGNIICDDDNLEEAREEQINTVDKIIKNNHFPIVIGGGHETALGNFLALIKTYKNVGIINIDAHFDLRTPNPKSTSGTPFYEMSKYCEANNLNFNYIPIGIQELGNTKALFKRAEDLNVEYITADEVHLNLNNILDKLKREIQQYDALYISLDMDVLDAAFAPGVSATTVNGLTPFQVKYILKLLMKSEKVKLFDIVEYNSNFDRDNMTSKLSAQMIYEVLRS
jgi:formiminoglutamase